jgi:uncharacterized membrane protein (UPF0127 family)
MDWTRAPSVVLMGAGALLVVGLALTHAGLLPVSADFGDERELRVTDCAGTETGQLTVDVAESFSERYVGLSRTESLAADEGLLFVYDEGGSKSIAMRNMDFALDVVFVSATGEITRIETLDAPDSLLAYYLTYDSTSGPGRFVVETTAGWTDAHGASAGDCVRGLPA